MIFLQTSIFCILTQGIRCLDTIRLMQQWRNSIGCFINPPWTELLKHPNNIFSMRYIIVCATSHVCGRTIKVSKLWITRWPVDRNNSPNIEHSRTFKPRNKQHKKTSLQQLYNSTCIKYPFNLQWKGVMGGDIGREEHHVGVGTYVWRWLWKGMHFILPCQLERYKRGLCVRCRRCAL